MDIKRMKNSYMNGYKTQASHYDFLGDDIQNAFPLMKYEKYLTFILFEVDKDVFDAPKFLVIVDNYNHPEETIKVRQEDYENIKRFLMDSEKRKRFEFFFEHYYEEVSSKKVFKIEPIRLINDNNLTLNGKYEADRDYKEWSDENKTHLDNYNHDKISPYSHLDYEGLILNFDSQKYNSDFSYQMEQANECYKRKLFLPAAATLSVALETLLMAICDKENVKLNSKDTNNTLMNYLGQRLLSEGKINYRMHKRIDITYSLRNSVSHSNPGEVSKADCQIILSCIKVLIDDHYSK
ncbi:hypothetical protein I0622_000987 [Staphylococcus pseudintermedius]|uniref:hypothetical protein n=3 Tax=Staphylococcus pseudintermedius TaxID=283734 RepID=UPI000BBB9ABE|nr:hypothetical protein [Staphylococcus pseudintermedius]QKN86116.1 hypothetical protein pSpJ_11 [Staphylococcus virus pSp_SNUABM-J]QKN86189.1 hypothetical protein pSpS_09 [Staphylococcus virus pSp_SNUABM-S]EGQ3124427.1 hypothetical protein [Staphylococcus pseudintermedius]EGQ3639939.1 hypothetical protein [Staphylococcus pseudintermedius]EGQ3856903.1 hypothetical protein [Staphylococcus pseudintermedius]